MSFTINSQNVIDYLVAHKLCSHEEKYLLKVEQKLAKNFNLLLTLPGERQLLVKQERHNQEGKTAGEFLNEWRLHEFLKQFPELSYIRSSISEVLHFDAKHSIIVFNYLNGYRDLADFYAKENFFPTAIAKRSGEAPIASAIGTILATVHRVTLDRQDYRDFLSQNSEGDIISYTPNFGLGLERISPEVFGLVPADGLKFFALYQRYDSLGKAIAELSTAFEPCCLTHNDLKLNNILLHNDWEQAISKVDQSSHSIVRLIDWERSSWGDPAFDLGMLIASYLQIWLNSLVISKSIDIQEALRLAMTPLDMLQPSIAALTKAYLGEFPEILERRPHFIKRVVQFSGLGLIQQIQAMIQHQKSFGNGGICMLQVAKTLLCRPEQSIPTVFGVAESELISFNRSLI
ncbi:aminoglycoside phosphotransferase family protein [Brasilonema octagenarum UFV-E1]|uniref:Aminoglycoside phosphotransferase family protein n=1 Tax=Brasilonema sennae CENA114 TaxID=415709 RepID=A0A856MJW0_9CYAN|nr:phosphotransferase [Brasilonema sennae]QDL10599.1 aminoglycoside phosphotransferase family protein [Brasilonema sennae CENA114]QDL16942.1 aminoglycoside phosphotransferase family protein [Brasilonema octagenarum UFV-E1]